jgi:hypothetical protein
MKLSCALVEMTRRVVPDCGMRTLDDGMAEDQ